MKFKVGDKVIRLEGHGADNVIAILVKFCGELFDSSQVFEVKYTRNEQVSQWNSTFFRKLTPLDELL